MSYDVQITELKPQVVAATRLHTTLLRIGNDIGIGFGSLMRALGKEGIEPSGPPLIIYHELIDAETDGDVEICVPVNGHVSGDSKVYGRELEGGTMATTVHRGPYQKITPAYVALKTWISEQGHEMTGPPRETYLNDPQIVPPEELLTRVEFPICTKAD